MGLLHRGGGGRRPDCRVHSGVDRVRRQLGAVADELQHEHRIAGDEPRCVDAGSRGPGGGAITGALRPDR